MRNSTRDVKQVLVQGFHAYRRFNNKCGIRKKKIPITRLRKGEERTPLVLLNDFNARIPQHLRNIARGKIPDIIRAAFALGRIEGMRITLKHQRRKT